MNILIARPPIYDDIVRVFPEAAQPGLIFAWGNAIYNPSGIELTPELMSHEQVHRNRQGIYEASIRRWWEFYLKEPQFRLQEEIPAHQAEYKKFCQRNKNREMRPAFLDQLTERLSGPLYGSLISAKAARKLLV